ncbi:MAG: tRNA (guanosine(46)-N7)-methyltransferase TrmB [Saprospiraceae bacterium]|nr:tRNA (guanosine(46)-N7)-methyltransferase TrmB [Saprospiraceae bacterium]
MPARNKLQKFAENLRFPNVFENFDPKSNELSGLNGSAVDFSAGWNKFYFKNDNPIVLELACGRGEYSLALAQMNPHLNYIGVDVKGARIWRGAKNAIESGIQNLAFLRTRIENIERFFKTEEVSEIWITFPDPFLKNSKSNRRLTSEVFLIKYSNILKRGGTIHLKTDSPELYEFTLEVLNDQKEITELQYQNDDIYSAPLQFPELEIKTYYENQHLSEGKSIKYIRFSVNK